MHYQAEPLAVPTGRGCSRTTGTAKACETGRRAEGAMMVMEGSLLAAARAVSLVCAGVDDVDQ
jgi:hypothetical protein